MAGASIKIGASSSEFQKQMKEVTRELKLVSSECGLATEKAKLFGSTQEKLTAVQKELTAKMQAQNQMVQLYKDRITGINGEIDKQKSKQAELTTKIEDANKKYKESVEQTGKNSEESKKLKEELQGLIEGIVRHNFVNIATVKENKKILSTIDTNATVVEGTSYKDVELELAKALPSNKAGLVVLVNPKAYATLKTARDKNDRSLNLITNINGQEYAFDTCPIHGFDNGLVTGTDEKELYYILDMKEAIQFIERKGITILRDTNIKKMGAPVIAVGEKFDVVKGSARSIKKNSYRSVERFILSTLF